jgi:predicted permease
LVEELIDRGMDPAAARREARTRFGDPAAWKKKTHRSNPRRTGTTTTMTRILQDLRFALRGFRRNPGFAAMAVLTLAVALAGNTAIFSVLDAAVLRALPFPDADDLVFVNGVHRTNGEEAVRMASVPEFRDWQERTRTLDPLVASMGNTLTMTGTPEADRVEAELVTEGYFELLGGVTTLGRTFTAEELAITDAYPVVVLSHALWQRAFNGDPAVVGRTLELNQRSVEVVGVMGEGFRGSSLSTDVWAPLAMVSLIASPELLDARGSRFLPVMGRLVPGATLDGVAAEFETITGSLQEEYPSAHEDRFAQIVPFKEGFLGTTGDLLWILFGAGALLLVLAGANVANLLLVRAHTRSLELTLRRAIGADSGRITAQLLTESVALALVGGALGLLLAGWALRAALPLIPAGVLPAYAQPALSARAFGFTLLVLAVVGIASGLVPAVTSARRDLAGALRSGRGGLAGRGNRAQKLFVVTQVGLALMLLVGAGLLARSFRAQLSIDPGLEMEAIHALRVQPPAERYPDGESLRIYADELRRQVSEVPGVASVALSSDFPFRGGSSGSYAFDPADLETRIRIHRHSVSPGFFEQLQVRRADGRLLDAADDADAPGVVVVTRAFADRVFPDDPSIVGRQVYVGPPNSPDNLAEIVGVVDNVRFRNLTQDMLDGPNSPDVFFSLAQVPSRTQEVSYRVEGDPAAVTAAVRRVVQQLDASTPAFAMASLQELYDSQTAMPRLAAVLMGAFSLLALSLASVGIYGVLTFTVGQRGPEIALRRALGADAGDVARSVVADSLKLAGVGIVIGGVAALAGASVLESLLYQVETTDVATLGVTGVALLLVAAVAAAVPAMRAARKSPADALGGE